MKAAKKTKAAKVGECCPSMDFVTMRGSDSRLGISCETGFNYKTGETYPAVVTRFRKARRGEGGPFGHGTKFADTDFAMLNFCPFCGKQIAGRS